MWDQYRANIASVCGERCSDLAAVSRQGLKTGMYYLRTKPAVNAIQFTVDKTKLKAGAAASAAAAAAQEDNMAALQCSLRNRDECTMCSG